MEGLFVSGLKGITRVHKNLVLRDTTSFLYTSGGKGYAKGIDVFLKSTVTNKYSTWNIIRIY